MASPARQVESKATGTVQVSTTPLISPEEIDQACKKSVKYRAPGV